MNLKYSGVLFVLIVIVDAISGTVIGSSLTERSRSSDLPAVSETSQSQESATESLKIIPHGVPESTLTPKFMDVTLLPSDDKPATPTALVTNAMSTFGQQLRDPSTTTTTTPAPTSAAPAPEKGTWVVRNETTNMTCIIAEMAMQLNVTYPVQNKVESTVLNVPKNSKANGTCSDTAQSMLISWGPGHSITINFSTNKTTNTFFVSGLSLEVNATVFKDAKGNSTWRFFNQSSEFVTPRQMSYKCNKVQNLNMTSQTPKVNAVLSFKDTQIEAFMNKTKAEFGAAQDCDSFDTPDIVPIAVGCALAILVLVVLVAYVIGRKRSQNRGYLSM